MDPKLIKGPDVFINCMNLLKSKIPHLQVLLTGPSRGDVKKKLNELKIPYQHHYIKSYQDIQKFYHALDLYIIPSREEGGPRAQLESMACGIPLVTTNVGMSIDLVEHQVNGWKVDVEDYEDLCYWAEHVLENNNSLNNVLSNARKTAELNSYDSQKILYKKFFQSFIES